jgi:hypothetical protein
MGYLDFSERMPNSYKQENLEMGPKKTPLPFVNLIILDSYIVCKSCRRNMTHLKLRNQLVRDVVVLTHEENAEECSVAFQRLK